MVPVAYGGSATAYKAAVEALQASPLSNEQFSAMTASRARTSSSGSRTVSPGGLYCADETDGEALRVCEQINESLLAYEVNGTERSRPGRELRVERRPDGVDLHAA